MEDKGYIKLFRKLLKSPIWDNEKALKIWLWCLLKATHIERDQLVGQQIIHLEKGQFVTGRKKASDELKMKGRTIYDYLKTLEKSHMISIKSNNKFSVISIEKWEDYQIEELQINNKPTTSQQQTNTNKNVKNNIYLFLFNKYKAQLEGKTFSEQVKLINLCKSEKEYSTLSLEDQYSLFNQLISIK